MVEAGHLRLLEIERMLDIDQSVLIAEGGDSRVFKAPSGKVYKDYVEGELELIQNYQNLTNRACEWLRENPTDRTIQINDELWQIRTEIVPIDEVIITDQGTTGISKYIAGPVLDDIVFRQKTNGFETLEDKEERSFLFSLKDDEMLRENFNLEVKNCIKELTFQISKYFGVEKLHFSSINIKVRADVQEKIIQLVVTDLSDCIPMIIFNSDFISKL